VKTERIYSYLQMSVSFGLIALVALIALQGTTFFGAAYAFVYPMGNLSASVTGSANSFVTRSGSTLLLKGKAFRFSGANIYWLGLEETNTGIVYPSHFQVDDALATAQLMGATVVRSHTLGISVGCSICVEPTLGNFNQAALQQIDYAIQSAHNHGIKLIIPLTDNWHYYHGGKHTFTDWRGISDENQFYTNPLVISDFQRYVSVILNHVNTYTGIAYKDDPTVMVWELGNELSAPAAWVQKMANYIKGIDSKHLVMDGNYEQANEVTNFLPDLKIPAVDIYAGHFYPPTLLAFEKEALQAYNAKKVYLADEYDWNTNTDNSLSLFLNAIKNSTASGDLYWSLFPHADRYGYVIETEHYTLHYPGDTPDMRSRVSLLRNHAFAMQGMPVPSLAPPGTPVITFVNGKEIAWRGVAGAVAYTIERSTTRANGPWTVICNKCATDDDTPWIDKSQPQGSVWYRVEGFSVSGIADAFSSVFKK